jgi:hypothetical protein
MSPDGQPGIPTAVSGGLVAARGPSPLPEH